MEGSLLKLKFRCILCMLYYGHFKKNKRNIGISRKGEREGEGPSREMKF